MSEAQSTPPGIKAQPEDNLAGIPGVGPEPVQGYRENLPPGVIRQPGRGLIRKITHGNGRVITRDVALTQEEAKEKRRDFFHPEFGWLIDGFKPERDRSVSSIMADNSTNISS